MATGPIPFSWLQSTPPAADVPFSLFRVQVLFFRDGEELLNLESSGEELPSQSLDQRYKAQGDLWLLRILLSSIK